MSRDAKLLQFAKQLRRVPTGPEQRLWLALRAKRFEAAKFRRQKVIGRYIVDFACRVPMLVIEVDGESHGGREDQDAHRTTYLQDQGYRVIRFTNTDVMTNLEGVLLTIQHHLRPPLPTLSPEGERAL